MTIAEEIELFASITNTMVDIFGSKRNDYGQTTTETFKRFGPVSMLVRMHDKLGRLDKLLGDETNRLVKNESVDDTLVDLANYAIITLIELIKLRREMSGGTSVAQGVPYSVKSL